MLLKPVAIIIDDFTYRSLDGNNVTFYDAGYLNSVTDYDYWTLDGLTVDGYGDVDYSQYTYCAPFKAS